MGNDVAVFNKLEEEILKLRVKGYTKEDIANELDIPLNVVRRLFYKPGVKEKLQEINETRALILQDMQLELLEKATLEYMEKINEAGTFDVALNKGRDILDVISLTNQVNRELERKRLNTGEKNLIVNILQQLSGDSDE